MRLENQKAIGLQEDREGALRRERRAFFLEFLWIVVKITVSISLMAVLVQTYYSETLTEERPANLWEVLRVIRKLNNAQANFAATNPQGRCGTFTELVDSGAFNDECRSEVWRGYRFLVQPGDNPQSYWIKVSPLDSSVKGTCYWFSSSNGPIHRSSSDFSVDTAACWFGDGFTLISDR